VRADKDATMKVIGKYTRQQDQEALRIFYEELIRDLPRVPYVEDESARAAVEEIERIGMSARGLDYKTLYDNGLLKRIEASGFADKLYSNPRLPPR